MFTKRLTFCLLVLSILSLAACGAKATAEAPRTSQPVYAVATEAPAEGYDGFIATLEPPNDQAYDDVFFENYGVNPFVDTEDDNLSTFAMDVDTGSYTIMRRYVSDGNLPPKDAIRVEEFINYFDLGYALPPEGKAFEIHIDGSPTPFGETERYQMIRIGIQGYAVPAEMRKNVSLTFVIDVSGSMEMEDRLELVKESLELLVEQLHEGDQVGIVVYGTSAHAILKPTSGDQKQNILKAIRSLHPEGVTNAEDGLRLGYKMAAQSFNPDGINRVILCSDGVANFGNTGAGSILETIEDSASEGITLTTVGFGMGNYNDVLMEQLADDGDGFYAYVDTLKEAERIFVDNLTSTLQVIALDAKVQVDINPEVVSRYRLVGYENRAIQDEDFRDNTVDAGEIGAGHSVTALYEVKLHENASGRIATVFLRWEDPDTHAVTEISEEIDSSQMAGRFTASSPYFQWSVIVAEYAEILRESYWAQGSTLAGVLEEAQRIVISLPENSDFSEFISLLRNASRLAAE